MAKLFQNRCYVFGVIAILLSAVLSGGYFAYARISRDAGDIIVKTNAAEDNVQTHFKVSTTTEFSAVLVDLSDNNLVTGASFPQTRGSGHIEIAKIYGNVLFGTQSSTTLKFGVIVSALPSGANVDIHWFDEVIFDIPAANVSTANSFVFDYNPSALNLKLSGSLPDKFLSSDSSASTTEFATTSKKVSPKSDNSFPGIGDLVMKVVGKTGSSTINVSVLYDVKPD